MIEKSFHKMPCRDVVRGMTLIDAIFFMVIVATAVGTLLSVFANSNRGSIEVLLDKQALLIAEALMTEVRSMPFTYCDPNVSNVGIAAKPADCLGPKEDLTPGGFELGETRSGALPFDNVSDYNNLVINPITDQSGVAVAGLGVYTATISVTPLAGVATPWHGITTTAEIAHITVTVTAPNLLAPVVLEALRTRYDSNAVKARLP